MPEQSSSAGKWRWLRWRTLLVAVSAMALFVLVLNPELAALGFLFDPVLLDVAIMLLGTQVLLFNGQLRTLLMAAGSTAARRLRTVGSRR